MIPTANALSEEKLVEPLGRHAAGGIGAVAQFEREIVFERQREGIAKARAGGKYKGWAPTAHVKTIEIKTLRGQGISAAEIAKRLKVGHASVYRIFAA